MKIKESKSKSGTFLLVLTVLLLLGISLFSNVDLVSADEPEINLEGATSINWNALLEWADLARGGLNFIFSYQYGSADFFVYLPHIWQPSEDEQRCSLCNNEDVFRYGCSEYECRSLGHNCFWENNAEYPGVCVVNEGDYLAPEIQAREEVLKINYSYKPVGVVSPEHGVRIVYEGPGGGSEGCIPVYTNLTLGIHTSEVAKCRWSMDRFQSYEEMQGLMKPRAWFKKHELFLPTFLFPSGESLNDLGIVIDPEKDYSFYMRCEDYWGNVNIANFIMKFCVQDEPDMTAPEMEIFPSNPYYVQYDLTQAYFEVHTNEPADCSWDFTDKEFEDMLYPMENCSQDDTDFLKPNTFGCKGNLTGIKSGETQNYYVRCNDKPWWQEGDEGIRISNDESKMVIVVGSYPLVIEELTVNGKENNSLIKDATDHIDVELNAETSGGMSEEGYAVCKWSVDNGVNYYPFYETSGYNHQVSTHTQSQLQFNEGEHQIFVKCTDDAGNVAKDSITFTIEMDKQAPEVVRVYYEDGNLKITTNEPAECVYSLFETGCGFNFDDGNSMYPDGEGYNHFMSWTTDSDVFIKCKDEYGNIPVPSGNTNICTIVVRGSDYYN